MGQQDCGRFRSTEAPSTPSCSCDPGQCERCIHASAHRSDVHPSASFGQPRFAGSSCGRHSPACGTSSFELDATWSS
jgi:hypothetical protein